MDVKKPLFPSAFDVAAPKGAEGWEELYPYYTRFQPARRAEDDQKFWFCNSQHWPTPLRSFDVIFLDFAIKCLSQYNSRHLLVPPANSVLAGFAPTGVGEIARSQGLWSVGTMFVAASDPLQLYRAPIEPVHFTLALPVVAAAAVMVRRPGWLLLALPLMLAALCVAAPVAVMALADARAPVTVLLPAGDGSFVAADFGLPETQRAVLRLAQNTIVHFLLLVLPVLVLSHRRAPA